VPILFISLTVFFLDQLSKFFIVKALGGVSTLPVVPGIFHLTPLTNPGVAFGLLRGYGVGVTLGTTLLLIGLLLSVLKGKKKGPALTVGLGLILGGAIGNLVDRLRVGGVIDFLDFRIWPVFNVADSCITIGAVLMAWHLLRHR